MWHLAFLLVKGIKVTVLEGLKIYPCLFCFFFNKFFPCPPQ